MILLTHECVIAKEQKRNDDKQAKVERKKMQKIQAAPLPKVWNSEEEDEVEVDEDPTAKGLEMVLYLFQHAVVRIHARKKFSFK